MKKTDMITKMQNTESKLWLELATYDFNNKPIFTNQIDSMAWETNDMNRKVLIQAWRAVKELMESMDIETIFNEDNKEATELYSKVWCRERDARETT